MKRPSRKSFHELPLVFFASLLMAGSGVGTAHLLLSLLGWAPWIPTRGVVALMAGLLVAGLAFSTGHLGRPLRGPFALYRVGRSPLSNEVLVVGAAALAAGLAALIPPAHGLVGPVRVLAVLLSPIALLAMADVYRLKGQLAWWGPALFHPLILGAALGVAVLMGDLPAGTRARGEILFFVLLALDGLLVWERFLRINSGLSRGIPAHPSLMRQRVAASLLRVLTGVLLPAVLLQQGWLIFAGLALFANLFLDRFLFYGLALRANTEAEVKRVEEALSAAVADRG